MDEKEIKVSESIKILGELSLSRRQQYTENFSSESKSIGDFEFDEFSATTYCSGSYDDEVFVDPEEISNLKGIGVIHEPRKRRTSDVIDSMGDTPPKEKAHFFPNDFFDVEGPSSKIGSPPVTPENIEVPYMPAVFGEIDYNSWANSIDKNTAEQRSVDLTYFPIALSDKGNNSNPFVIENWKWLFHKGIKVKKSRKNGSVTIKCLESSLSSKILKDITFFYFIFSTTLDKRLFSKVILRCSSIDLIENSEILQQLKGDNVFKIKCITPKSGRSTLMSILPQRLHIVNTTSRISKCTKPTHVYNIFGVNCVGNSCENPSICGKYCKIRHSGESNLEIKSFSCGHPTRCSCRVHRKKYGNFQQKTITKTFFQEKTEICSSINSFTCAKETVNLPARDELLITLFGTLERIESKMVIPNYQNDDLNKKQYNTFDNILSDIVLRLSNIEKKMQANQEASMHYNLCSNLTSCQQQSSENALPRNKIENILPEHCKSSHSGSDMGYFSTCGLSTPPSLLDFKPAWSRFSSFSEGPSMEYKKQGNPILDQTDAGDESDAKPNRPPSYTHPNPPEAKMPVARDSSEYNMNHPRRGCAHIFNHDTFSNLMPPRKGSDVDVKELETVYKLLGFEVEVHQNLDFAGLQTVIQRITKEDYTDCDCISISVLTHGQESNLLYTSDCLYSVDSLWQSFTPDKCPTLAGKPKIFFIQACRGQKLDGGATLGRNTTETDSASDSYKIPKMADFLVAYSTADGYYSWRNPENGTWFVQSLCHVLREHHETTDLLRMLTIVSRKVAIEHESYNNVRLDLNAQKQVPSISSTLIRDVFLRPK